MRKDGRQRLDDLAGMAGGAFSVFAGLRAEMEAMARAQAEAIVRKLELARAEDLLAEAPGFYTPAEELLLLQFERRNAASGARQRRAGDPAASRRG